MRLRTKIALILGMALVLTLGTLFIFFRQQFITYTLWTVGIVFGILLLFGLAGAEHTPGYKEYETYPFLRRIGHIYGDPIYDIVWLIFRRK